jgi:hypothetical protein
MASSDVGNEGASFAPQPLEPVLVPRIGHCGGNWWAGVACCRRGSSLEREVEYVPSGDPSAVPTPLPFTTDSSPLTSPDMLRAQCLTSNPRLSTIVHASIDIN